MSLLDRQKSVNLGVRKEKLFFTGRQNNTYMHMISLIFCLKQCIYVHKYACSTHTHTLGRGTKLRNGHYLLGGVRKSSVKG